MALPPRCATPNGVVTFKANRVYENDASERKPSCFVSLCVVRLHRLAGGGLQCRGRVWRCSSPPAALVFCWDRHMQIRPPTPPFFFSSCARGIISVPSVWQRRSDLPLCFAGGRWGGAGRGVRGGPAATPVSALCISAHVFALSVRAQQPKKPIKLSCANSLHPFNAPSKGWMDGWMEGGRGEKSTPCRSRRTQVRPVCWLSGAAPIAAPIASPSDVYPETPAGRPAASAAAHRRRSHYQTHICHYSSSHLHLISLFHLFPQFHSTAKPTSHSSSVLLLLCFFSAPVATGLSHISSFK